MNLFTGLFRHRQPELMDQLDVPLAEHKAALAGLARINRLSGSTRILWPAIAKLLISEPNKDWTLLDIATGAGDIPCNLWLKAKRSNLNLDVSACDRSEQALDLARNLAHHKGAMVRFFPWDVLSEPSGVQYDIVTCSLFLHHLSEPDAIAFLKKAASIAKHMLLINDLERSRAGFMLAYVGTRMLSRSRMVHVDGPRSVEGAFTVDEVASLAGRAGLSGAEVQRRWPCRFLLTWKRP